jgi:hypothetical protein
MPSSKIIPSCAQLIQQQFLPHVPKRWQCQFRFGVQALTLKPFASLASNARQTVSNPATASTKMDRLMNNAGLTGAISNAIKHLGIIHPNSLVNCDHSDFNGLAAFVGAVQTKKGRAIPCLVATTYSQRVPAHPDAPKRKQKMRAARGQLDYGIYDQVRTTLEEFTRSLGFWPRFVFDRGFMGLELVRLFARHQAVFYVRLKADRLVELNGTSVPVSELVDRDSRIMVAGIPLRVIRSDQPDGDDEPWYILTSDMKTKRNKIIRIYYYRFEIEETFKDLKHILDLIRTRLMKPVSLQLLLWFASLSFILGYLSGIRDRSNYPNQPKKKISWYRQFFEALQREVYGPAADIITGGL